MAFLKWLGWARSRETGSFALSLALLALVGFAVAGSFGHLFIAIMTSAATAAGFIRWLFKKGRFLALTLINLIAVYAAVYAFFIDALFGAVGPATAAIGFSLPVFSFLAGCWLWRADVAVVIDEPQIRDSTSLLRALVWMAPVFSVGAAALVMSFLTQASINSDAMLLVSMSLIALIVLAVSKNVATFLVDAGLLFEEFFRRMSRLAIPAFAFLTFYALLVIVFASLYTITSQLSTEPPFLVGGVPRPLKFAEALHFSIVTISTVGYGDIVPATSAARALASAEVICGVLLLLFGFSELQEYAREHRHERNNHERNRLEGHKLAKSREHPGE